MAEKIETNKKIRTCRWFIVQTAMTLSLLFLTSTLIAQEPILRKHYLSAPPLPPSTTIATATTTTTANPTTKQAVGIAALPKRTMTLSEISRLATQNHPGVQQAKRQAEALQGAWIQAGLKSNPTLGYSGEDMTHGNAGTQGITVSQPVTPKYKLNARQSAIHREYHAANHVYQIQCQKAINDAMLMAYRVAFAHRKCLILEELNRYSQESRQAGAELLKAGEMGRSAFLDINIQAERMRIALKDAEIAYRTACRELAILLALPERELMDITDSVETLPPELDESIVLAEIRASSPELRQAYAEVESAKARLRQQCAEAGIDYETNARIAYNTETKQSEFSVGVAIPLRLFDRNQGNIKQAQSELSASYRNVERLDRQLAQKFEQQWGNYQTARHRVVSYKEGILSDAQESLNLALAAYRHGESSSVEILHAQETFLTVQIEYLDNLCALMESQVLLQGALLSGGLDKPEF